MKHLFGFYILITATTFGGTAWADTPATVQLRLEATPKTITIGDVIKMEIAVTASSTVTPAPFKPEGSLGEFELRDLKTGVVKSLDNGKISFTHTLLLTSFSTGTQIIPALPLHFQNTDGSLAETKTEEIKIEVRSLLAEKGDEGNLRPLKGLYNFRSYLWLWIILGLLVSGGIGYWLFDRYKKASRGQAGSVLEPSKKPEEWAWDLIHKLEDADYIEAGKIKEYYSQLSYILKGYLERRYQMPALDRTSSELLSDIRKANFSSQLSALLREFLESGDLVKFAKYTPDAAEIEKDLLRVKEAVTITTPVAETKEADAKEIPV